MSFLTRRASAPVLAGLAFAAAVPFVAPVAANASMGGAIPATTTLRPDLRSATVTNIDPVNATQTVRYVFNKDIGSTPIATQFFVGEYSQESQVLSTPDAADSAIRSASNTVDATFSIDGDIDIAQYTFASVGAPNYPTTETGAAVVSSAQGKSNIPDSAPLVGSTSNSGTRGKTTRPDLIGVTVNNGANTINYIFDQKLLNIDTPAVPDFHFTRVNGTNGDATTGATDVTFADNVVTAKFAAGVTGVSTAVRAFVDPGAVQAKSNGRFNLDVQSAVRPGNGNVTDAPDLVGASITAPGDELVLQYDAPVAVGAALPSIVYSDGTLNAANLVLDAAKTGVGNNTQVWDIPSGTITNERMVSAFVRANTAVSVVGAVPNTAESLPVGGNAGALASGYTDGPEALRVTFNNASGVATVLFDQRFAAADLTKFVLIDDTGSAISGTPTSVGGAGNPAAGQATATVQFTSAQLSGARSLLLRAAAVSTTGTASPNVDQALSPTATASVLRKGSKVKFRAHQK